MVEGYRPSFLNSRCARLANLDNTRYHCMDIIEHGFGWHTQRCDVLGAQELCPDFIFSGPFD